MDIYVISCFLLLIISIAESVLAFVLAPSASVVLDTFFRYVFSGVWIITNLFIVVIGGAFGLFRKSWDRVSREDDESQQILYWDV